jgi:hypothetical protein
MLKFVLLQLATVVSNTVPQSLTHGLYIAQVDLLVLCTVSLCALNLLLLVTVTARCKAWAVFARSNAGIVGSNPTQDMDVCIVCIYSVYR